MDPKVVVVMPAYNAEKTLEKTLLEIPESVSDVILVDDCSKDNTYELAKKLGLKVFRHDNNKGYGGNQKTCYAEALKLNPDIVIMLHPDYQYSPKLLGAMIEMIRSGHYDVVLATRILGRGAILGKMPKYKYIANRILTLFENLLIGEKLSEYHTGYRAFTGEVLRKIDFDKNSDDFIFDNQMLLQIFSKKFRIGEISCPTKYFSDASSINLKRSIKYGFGCLVEAIKYRMCKIFKKSYR